MLSCDDDEEDEQEDDDECQPFNKCSSSMVTAGPIVVTGEQHMWKNVSLLIVLLSLFLPVSGCSAISRSPGVEQTIWILDSFADASVEVDSYGSVMPHARLIDGTVSGHLGVNSFTGTYELSGNDIRFSQLASTKKTDVPKAVEQETLFLAALEAAALVHVVDQTLTISDSADTVLMRFTEALEG